MAINVAEGFLAGQFRVTVRSQRALMLGRFWGRRVFRLDDRSFPVRCQPLARHSPCPNPDLANRRNELLGCDGQEVTLRNRGLRIAPSSSLAA